MVEIVMTGHVMLLAALLVQAHPVALSLHEIVRDRHLRDGADAGEAVGHEADQGTVAQADEVGACPRHAVFLDCFSNRDAVEEHAGLVGRQDGRLALFYDVFWAAHGMGRINLNNVADDQPVEQHPERGEMLLDRWRRQFGLQILYESGDVKRLHAGKLVDVFLAAPGGEAPRRVKVCPARVIVVDLRREEFEHALCGFRRGRKERRGPQIGRRRDDDFVGH